jgi:hypothetical protein
VTLIDSGGDSEQDVRKTNWRFGFQHVQYGFYYGIPVCLVIIDGDFNAGDDQRHRSTSARVKIDFSSDEGLVKVCKLEPKLAHGISIPEQHNIS